MSLFSKMFRSPKSGKYPSNNFENIAFNMAIIREILQTKYKDSFPDDDTLLIACGAIDTIVYLQEGSISLEDIRMGLMVAKSGGIRLGTILRRHEDIAQAWFFSDLENIFLNFTLQIEAMIFYVDEKRSSEIDIISAVLSKKKNTKGMIDIATMDFQSGKYPRELPRLLERIETFMISEESQPLREEIGIITKK